MVLLTSIFNSDATDGVRDASSGNASDDDWDCFGYGDGDDTSVDGDGNGETDGNAFRY